MANCSDNSYVIYYTNLDQGTIQIQKSALITDELDIALIGKTRLEYGEIFNENIVHVLEHFACPEQIGNPGNPDLNQAFGNLLENPTIGQIWYNKTQNKPFVYIGNGEWRGTSELSDVGGNSGVLAHGQFLPLPISQDGYNFTLSECSWTVSPFHVPSEIDFMHCFTDPTAKVTMQYRLEGTLPLVDGFANYQIIGIRNNTNRGTIDCQSSQAPTSTPLNSATPTPTPTPTVTFTPTITPTVTVTATATITPTPTMSATPGASLTPTPTETPNPSASPTITPTVTVTPTSTVTPTITPTTTITPSVTPSQPFNNGDVFAVAVRPQDLSLDGEAFYVRKLSMYNTFDTSFSRITFYDATIYPSEPTNSRPGQMIGDSYLAANNSGVGLYGVNLGVGVYNYAGTVGNTENFTPQFSSTDGTLIFTGDVNYTTTPVYNSQVSAYTFNGQSMVPVGTPYAFPNKLIIAVHTITFNTVMVVTADNETSTAHTWTALRFNGSVFIPDTNVLNIPDGTDNITILNQNWIVYASSDNELIAYRYVYNTGFIFYNALDYSAKTASLDSVQFDYATNHLMVAYRPTGSTTTTTFDGIVLSSNVMVIEQSTTIAKPFIVQEVRSIAADRNRLLALDNTNPTNLIMNVIVYNPSTGFAVNDTIPVQPIGRPIVEVAFINPNLPIPSPTPTPTATVTPTLTTTPTLTPTQTASQTPAVTSTSTPAVTPTPTSSTTPPNSPPASPPVTPTPSPAESPVPPVDCNCEAYGPGCFQTTGGGCQCPGEENERPCNV